MSNGISGIRIASAPPATPAYSAIQPGVAPHHLDDDDALCASAVVCSRSIASVANATAVSKPKQLVVPTMSLSIVFGTPTMRNAALAELVGDRERAVAADDDQRVEPHLVEHLERRGRA